MEQSCSPKNQSLCPSDAQRFDASMDDLCQRLARDVDSAFPDLVEVFSDDLYSGLRRLQPNDAEDLTQETLIRAYHALKGYDRKRIRALKLRSWVWTIALNLGRNHARNFARRPTAVRLEDHHILSSTDPDPVDDQAWDGRLGALSLIQRKTITLRYIVGLSNSEIADSLNRPLGTVKADIHRGLRRLRMTMEQET